MNRATWNLEFSVFKRSAQTWLLRARGARNVDVFLQGVEQEIEASRVDDVRIEWREDAAYVELHTEFRVQHVRARAAWSHEPRLEIYAVLPVEPMTPSARRFWRRVFTLARIPGGIRLIRYFRSKV